MSCPHCQASNRSDARFCRSCGRLLSEPTPVPELEPAPAFEAVADLQRAAWARVSDVVWLFGLLLALLGGGMIAIKLGSDELRIDVVATGLEVLLVLAFVARAPTLVLQPLRSHGLGGRGGLRLLGAALVFFAFASLYFELARRLGLDLLRMSDAYVAGGWPVLGMFAMLSLAPAVIEEIAFRGYILARLTSVLKLREALLVQAALFSVLHLAPLNFPSHFVMGAILGWLRLRTGSLVPGMILHASWNAWVLWLEL